MIIIGEAIGGSAFPVSQTLAGEEDYDNQIAISLGHVVRAGRRWIAIPPNYATAELHTRRRDAIEALQEMQGA